MYLPKAGHLVMSARLQSSLVQLQALAYWLSKSFHASPGAKAVLALVSGNDWHSPVIGVTPAGKSKVDLHPLCFSNNSISSASSIPAIKQEDISGAVPNCEIMEGSD